MPKTKGPADRLADLKIARQQTLNEMKSGESKRQGYDAKVRLERIDGEIRHWEDWLGKKK